MIIQNFPLHQNHLFKINFLLNTTEIFCVPESCLPEVWPFHKIVLFRKSTFNGFFQRLSNSQAKQWIYEQWPVNELHMLNERITKSFCLWCWPAFWCKSQMPNLEGLILGLLPHCTEQNFSQMHGEREGWAALELTGTLLNRCHYCFLMNYILI